MRLVFNAAAVVAASLMLSACLISDTPLFTAINAKAMPLAPGSYDACQTDGETMGDCKVMEVSSNAEGLYKFDLVDEDDATLARFKKLATNAWAAQMWSEGDDSYHYFVAEKRGGEFSLAMIACEALPKAVRDRYSKNGGMEVDDDATVCKAKNVSAVVAAAKAFRKTEASKKDRMVLTPAK